MDVVARYSPPTVGTSSIHATAVRHGVPSIHDGVRGSKVLSGDAHTSSHRSNAQSSSAGLQSSSRMGNQGGSDKREHDGDYESPPASASTTFHRSVQIALMEPVGSMSLSPANRDVVLAARKGLFIVDLENPYDQPRFLPHLTTWVPADVQWNPHPARANWVASTSNNKLLVWNLDRPVAPRIEPVLSGTTGGSLSGISPTTSATTSAGLRCASSGIVISPSTQSSTLPHPHHPSALAAGADLSTSRLSSISHVLDAHTRAITDINWSPFHPEILASCGIDTWTWAWDLRDPTRPKQGYSAWNAAMTQVKWNRATPHRLATSCDNKVLIWDDRKGALPLATIEAHENKIYGVDWSRDTSLGLSRLVTCSLDGSVKWWDLDSPAAQQAIGQQKLVTEPETTILTKTPVWRSRHLPFGQGVMTLPQRGDTSLSMWSKEKTDEPVHRFEGHTNTVKEYLIRTRGGTDRDHDDRQFQLITWSKDQTLRLWPISREMTLAVGHKPQAPIRVLQTRIGAPDVTYRAPSVSAELSKGLEQGLDGKSAHLLPSQAGDATPQSSSSFAAPSGATRALISGQGSKSGHGSLRIISPSASPQSLSPSNQRPFKVSSLGRSFEKAESLTHAMQKAARSPHFAFIEPQQQNARGSARARFAPESQRSQTSHLRSGRIDKSSARPSSHAKSSAAHGQIGRQHKRIHSHNVMTSSAASRTFMTRGTVGQPGSGKLGAAQKGNASRMDAVGWIAGVRMGQELGVKGRGTEDPPQSEDDFGTKSQSTVNADKSSLYGTEARSEVEDVDDSENQKGTAQILSEEIMTVSKQMAGIDFEKIDVSARTCSVTCYGPWGGQDLPCFIRITMTFPSNYPSRVPRFELEHNASVALKTRAFLLRNVSAILAEHSAQAPPVPSMEAVLSFLQGDTVNSKNMDDEERSAFPHWLAAAEAEESEEDEVLAPPELRLAPSLCGATFASNGTLVIFRSSTGTQSSGNATRSASRPASIDIHRAGTPGTGARFLHSYTALAGAMGSLARLAKDGVSVQDLDVVQLMSDQDFFAKRLQSQRVHNARALSSKPGSVVPVARFGDEKDEGVESRYGGSNLLQSRLKLMVSASGSRSSSRARPRGRARSASPAASREMDDKNRFGPVLSGFAATLPRMSHRRELAPQSKHSEVLLLDVGSLLGIPKAPLLLRHRSNSTPVSPAQLTPRAEAFKRLGYALALPKDLQSPDDGRKEPQSISASRRASPQGSRRGINPQAPHDAVSSNERIVEMDTAEAANQLPDVVADGSGMVFSDTAEDAEQRDFQDGYGIGSNDGSDSEGSHSDSEGSDDPDDEVTAYQLMRQTQHDAISPTAESILDTLIWVIPFGFVYLVLDVLIQQQYGAHPSVWTEMTRMAQAMPVLTMFIYYTAIKPAYWRNSGAWPRVVLQLFLLLVGTSCGCGFLFVYARSNNDVVQRRTAPLGTLWMYSVVRLDLSLVILSLSVVYGFTRYHALPLFD